MKFLRGILVCVTGLVLLAGCGLESIRKLGGETSSPDMSRWEKTANKGFLSYSCQSCSEAGAVVLYRSIHVGPDLSAENSREAIISSMSTALTPGAVKLENEKGQAVLTQAFSSLTVAGHKGLLGRYHYAPADTTGENNAGSGSGDGAAPSSPAPAVGYMFLIPSGETLLILQSVAANKEDAARYLREFAARLDKLA